MISLDVVAAGVIRSAGGVIELGQLLLSGDEQSGTDALLLSGDETDGDDCLENREIV